MEINTNYKKVNLLNCFTNNEKLLDYHKCQICRDILTNPLSCVGCEGHFCKDCIENYIIQNKQCPNSCTFTASKSSRIILNILDTLKFRCKNDIRGCPEELKYSQFFNHVELCQFDHKECPSCRKMILLKDYDDHLVKCDFMVIKCEGCEKTYLRKESSYHDESSCLKTLSLSVRKKYEELNIHCKNLENRLIKKNDETEELKKYCTQLENLIKEQNYKSDQIKISIEDNYINLENKIKDNLTQYYAKKDDVSDKYELFEKKVKEETNELQIKNLQLLENIKNVEEKYNERIGGLLQKNEEIYNYCTTMENKFNQIIKMFYIPNKIKFKIYQNKPVEHFTNFGFKIVYRQPYSWQCTLSELEEIKSQCNENTIICVGGKKLSENNFLVCCVDEALVALAKTESKTKSIKGKGAYWYNVENESFGFTDTEDILLGSANIKFSSNSISWHIQGLGGWNLGNIKGLNISNDYEKIIMIMDKILI